MTKTVQTAVVGVTGYAGAELARLLLHHPRLAAPLVFLGGRELAPLLKTLPPGRTPLQIAQSWSNRMPLESGMAIAGWLVTHGILVEQHGQSGAPS